MASDGSPILIDLLDSLSSINKRLNLIETALSVQSMQSEVDLGVGAIQPYIQPPPKDKSPQAVAQRYGQPPPYSYAQSQSQFQSRSKSKSQSKSPSSSISPLPSYANNNSHGLGTSPATSAWPGQPTIHAAAPAPIPTSTPSYTTTPTPTSIPTDKKKPYTKRSSQLLRLKNVHAKDISDDGTDYEVDTSDGDVHMRDEGVEAEVEAEADADDMDVEVKQEKEKQRQKDEEQTTTAPPISGRLEALPEGFVVTGRATLQEELDGWTIPRGYSMRINGTRSHGRRQKIRMVCFRGGRSRLRPKEDDDEKDSQNRRKATTDRVSKKCECPFRFELVEIRPGADEYAVHYTNDDHMQHNHAAADLMLDPRARKLPAALKAEVDQWLRFPSDDDKRGKKEKGWTIAKIQAELQKRGYGHVLDFDLRNRKRALLHKERLAQHKAKRGESSKGSAGSVGGSSAGDTPTG